MDRNTLLAFFLISLVLIFTPKYMEMVSPVSEPIGIEESSELDSVRTSDKQDANPQITETVSGRNQKVVTYKSPSLSQGLEKLLNINTSLYSMTLSSFYGGSFVSFKFNQYFKKDSQFVDIIRNQENLLIKVKDLDGNPLPLDGSWELVSHEKGVSQRVVYRKELYSKEYIYKTFVFHDDSYVIDLEVDLQGISNNIYRNSELAWRGGLSSTEENVDDDIYYFNSYALQGGELESLKVGSGESEETTLNGITDWAAIRTKYFAVAIIPGNTKSISSVTLSGVGDTTEVYGMSFVFDPIEKQSFQLYMGPLEYDRVRTLGVALESIMDFGWSFIRPISKGVLFSLKKMHGVIPNYGYVLIVFAFIVKILVYPLTKKSYQSMSAMQAVAPEVNALKEKYQSNPTKLNQATMELYKKRGVNPLGGCLPMLLQMPLLFALFQVFRTTIELRSEPFIWWIKDLSSPDAVFYLPFKVPLYGSHVAILPILMVVSMFIQQRMMSGAAQQPQQKTMQYFMTGFFFLMFNGFPSGLNLYYTLFNVLTIAQQKLIPPETPTS
jgi:YidC/Oxa1 family membrane protein insertase